MNLRISLIAIAALGMTASRAIGGVTLTAKGGDPKNDEVSTIYFEGNKMRVEKMGSDENSILIYDGDSQKLIHVDPNKKTFTEVTPEMLKARTAEAKKKMQDSMTKMSPEKRKQMEAMMANMDPEQRKRMQEMMSGETPAQDSKSQPETATWERTGATQTVTGHSCEGFKQIKKGKVTGAGCYIPWSTSAVAKADIAPLLKMEEFMAQAGFPGLRGHGALEELRNAPGFPGIWANVGEDGKERHKQTLTSIKRGGISTDKFQPPAGYTKVDVGG